LDEQKAARLTVRLFAICAARLAQGGKLL